MPAINDNVFNVLQVIATKLNADGSELSAPTEDDIVLISEPQQVDYSVTLKDGSKIDNLGPEGLVCQIEEDDEIQGIEATLKMAKLHTSLMLALNGGSIDGGTGKYKAPLRTSAKPSPYKFQFVHAVYEDGLGKSISAPEGYCIIEFRKAKGKVNTFGVGNRTFGNPSARIKGSEYVDAAVPANSVGPFSIESASALPTDALQDIEFTVISAPDTPVEGAAITVTAEDGVTTYTGTTSALGVATIQMPSGSYTYSIAKTAFTTGTGSFVVKLLDKDIAVTLVAS